MASMPIRTLENGEWEVVQGVPVDAFSQEKIDATIGELIEERDAVKDLLPG
jgi:malate dehydrogenase